MICDWGDLPILDMLDYARVGFVTEYGTLADAELQYRSERGSVGASAEIERRAALESD